MTSSNDVDDVTAFDESPINHTDGPDFRDHLSLPNVMLRKPQVSRDGARVGPPAGAHDCGEVVTSDQ